jgi:hypothetical protein
MIPLLVTPEATRIDPKRGSSGRTTPDGETFVSLFVPKGDDSVARGRRFGLSGAPSV